MHRTLPARWLNRALRIGELPPSAPVPLFLCPSLASPNRRLTVRRPNTGGLSGDRIPSQRRKFHSDVLNNRVEPIESAPLNQQSGKSADRKLPTTCSGCGAFTQTTDPDQLGYVNLQNKRVKNWLDQKDFNSEAEATREADVIAKALDGLDAGQIEALGLDPASMFATETPTPQAGTVFQPSARPNLRY